MSHSQRLSAVADVVRACADVIAGRVHGPEVPDWCARRGWEGWLLDLDDQALARLDEGASPRVDQGAPSELVDLGQAVRAALDWLPAPDEASAHRGARRGIAHQRKDRQVQALVARLQAGSWRPRRVVDVGSGLGRLTRALAAALDVPALGLERDVDRVARARARTAADGGDRAVRFEAVEVDDGLLGVGGDDLLVGLHACGSLGDAVVSAARRSGAGMALVGCCLQRIPGSERAPLSDAGRIGALDLPRDVLGLTNLQGRAHGVGGSAAEVAERRETRHALRLLLVARGEVFEPGAEARGVAGRHFDRGLEHVAGYVLARRGLAPASPDELRRATERAQVEHARVRRLSVPRVLLGRLLELAVVLDRACALEEAGREVTVEPLFPAEVSPRNLGLVAAGG